MKKVLLVLGTLAALLPSAAALGSEALERAIALAAEKRYAEAREVLDPVRARARGDPRVRLLHGILRAHEGRVDEAIGILVQLRRDHPELSELGNNLAVLYAAKGRLDDAREALLAALEREPSALGYANLGDLYTRLAHRAYARAHELAPGDHPPPEDGARAGAALSLPSPPDLPDASDPAVPAEAPSAVAAGEAGGAPAGGPATPPPGGDPEPGPEPDSEPEPPPAAAAAAGAAAARCVRTGVEDRNAVTEAMQWLEARGAMLAELRLENRVTVASYRVYLPPLASRAEAARKVREIRGRGVRDVAIISAGPLANGVSLGVYRNEGNLRGRVARLEKLGYPVRHEAIERKGRVYVVEASITDDPSALRAAWAKRWPERPLELVDCG